MDVDLSTDLAALGPLIAPLISGHSDVAIGTRLNRSSRVVRGPKREIISRCYNLILSSTLAAKFSDAQNGFKAIRAEVARELLPRVEDTAWFFDTELLVLAERAGMRIHEVPVDWVDDSESRVDIVATATADLKGVARMLRDFATGSISVAELRPDVQYPRIHRSLLGQAVRFAVIGVASAVAYLLLFLLLHDGLGAQAANLMALLVTAIANTAANRRFTFGMRGRAGAARHQFQGLAVFLMALGITSGALDALHSLVADTSRTVELAVLVVANVAATVLRFVLLRGWVFHAGRAGGGPMHEPFARRASRKAVSRI
jgi:putative flippase GtrA